MYEIAQDSITFPLEASVTVMPDGGYLVHDIRYPGKHSGDLIPPISLVRQKGRWVYATSKEETSFTIAAGRAIDTYERETGR